MVAIESLLDQAFSRAAGAPRIDGNRVTLLRDAAENYPAWMEAIAGARHYVHFESYIIRDDTSGRQFADALIAKAKEGVAVRLLYDWMAERLAASGIAVSHYTDAALGHALRDADAVVVGADAVSPDWFLNKSGTRMLAASAAQYGVPIYVLATRDKFLSAAVAEHLVVREESPAEVWPDAPAGITVRNQYFEATPLDLVTAVVSDAGVLGASLVPDACPTAGDDLLLNLSGTP